MMLTLSSIYSWDLGILAEPANQNQTELYQRAGWFVPDRGALPGGQSPEAVEAWYYAYQATGDQYWRDVAWACECLLCVLFTLCCWMLLMEFGGGLKAASTST